ncbi:hypothetical protein LTR10_002864 [Elasticomyces elasticus]|nr:hypothetical protein LTR10_002864 [Elasticomyces elasticus]KAK4967797.1 hypothetical protein LTR42_010124 [Elasticomyces elasticus]
MAPVPAPIVGRYKLYKAGTQKLAQWLGRTADGICDVRSITGNKKKSSKSFGGTTVKIRTRHFVVLAGAIAGASSPVAVPAYVLKLTEDVIEGRRYCANWYAAQPSKEGSDVNEQNNRHAHFITVLEEVLSLLSSCPIQYGPRGPPETTNATASPESHGLSNLFALLEVEDPSMNALGIAPVPLSSSAAPDFASPSSATPSSVAPQLPAGADAEVTRFEYTEEDAGGLAFEVWCLMEDLHDLRVYIIDRWFEYGRGELSILAVGVVTNTGFGMMRRHVAEFSGAHPEVDDYSKLLDVCNVRMMTIGRLHLALPEGAGKGPERPNSDINPAALLCPTAATLLSDFCQLFLKKIAEEACRTAKGREAFAKIKASLRDFVATDTTGCCRDHRFGETLSRHVPRIAMQTGEECDVAADEFLRGLLGICRHTSGAVPIWMVVACQTYMDIYDILGDCIDVGATAFIRSSVESAVAVRQYEAARKEFEFEYLQPTWQKHFDSVTGNGLQFAKKMEAYRKLSAADRGAIPDATIASEALPIEAIVELPVWPCEMTCTMKLADLVHGLTVCNDGLIVLALAHYYTAARRYGLVQVWEDMEMIIAQNSNFVIPTTDEADPHAMARHYRLALGVDASKVLRKSPADLPSDSHILKRAKRVDITPIIINTLLQYSTRNSGCSPDEVFELVLNDLAGMPNTEATAAEAKDAVSTRTFTPTQILEKLKQHFVASEVQLNFDYISFFKTCVEIMAEIMNNLSGSGIPSRQAPPFYKVVDFLLREAADAVAMGRPLATTVISRYTGVLEKAITKARNLTQAARDKSSGHIPEQLRPTLPFLKHNKSRTRIVAESKGFKFDGPGRNAAVYVPVMDTGELLEDVGLVESRLHAWFDTCGEGSHALKASTEEIGGDVVRAIGMQRWNIAASLIYLAQDAELAI